MTSGTRWVVLIAAIPIYTTSCVSSFIYQPPESGPTATLTVVGEHYDKPEFQNFGWTNMTKVQAVSDDCTKEIAGGNAPSRTFQIPANQPFYVRQAIDSPFGISVDLVAFFPIEGASYEFDVSVLQGWFAPRARNFIVGEVNGSNVKAHYYVREGPVVNVYKIENGNRITVPVVRSAEITPRVLYRNIIPRLSVAATRGPYDKARRGDQYAIAINIGSSFETIPNIGNVGSRIAALSGVETVQVAGHRVRFPFTWACKNPGLLEEMSRSGTYPE